MNLNEIIILIVAVIVNLGLLGFVYLRNPRSATHRLFSLLTLAMSLWSVTNYFAVNASSAESAIWLVRGVLFFATPMSVFFFFLMHTFPRSTMSLSRKAKLTWIILTTITMAITLSPYLFTDVELVPGSAPKPTPGFGMILFIPVGIGTIPLGVFYLLRKTSRAKGIQKTQLQFLILGVVTMFTLILTLNFISVVVYGSSTYNKYGPLFTLPFTLLAAYAIARHRLMDIRAAVARSLSFTFLLGIFGFLFSILFIFAVPPTARLLRIQEGLVAAVGALLAVLVARYLQGFLRRITDKVLFQQQINYRTALIDVSDKLSGTIHIQDVTSTVLDTMENIVRSKITLIFLLNSDSQEYRQVAARGADKANVSIPKNNIVFKHLEHKKGPVIKDELALEKEQEISNQHIEELELMNSAMDWLDASAVLPLFVNKKLTGVIVLGEKLSGEPYLQDDVEFLASFAPQAATALENARLYQESLEFGEKLKIEVERATHELAQANEQLRDLDKAKSEFLSIASHQLYTPLTAIRGYLSMIQEGDYGEPAKQQQPIIDIVAKSTTRLIDLIKNLLDISRIESGRLELNLESIDLVQMAAEIVEDLLPNAMKKDIDLLFQKPTEDIPNVVADRDRIRQVMLNFIDNAIKYTDQGTVDVGVIRRGNEVIFSVKDTGKGLTPSEIAKLFNKFIRVGGASRYNTEGTGLGLYVAQQIVKEHRGDVDVTSPGTDKGSTFSMRLPAENTANSLKVGQKASVVIKAAEATGAVTSKK